MSRSLLTGWLGRLTMTALTIAAMAFATRELRSFVEAEALEAIDAPRSALSLRLVLEVADAPPVSNALAPLKRDHYPARFSGEATGGFCVPATVKPVTRGPILAI